MPNSVAEVMSNTAFPIPAVTSRRSSGNFSSTERGKGVLSRIPITTWKFFSRSANSSSSAIWSWKNRTLIPAGNWDQSAICSATA